jgi:hypothetical protein
MVILSGVILSAFIASALGAPPAIAPFPESVADVDSNAKLMLLDIEPQPMADALTDWAQQTGMQLIVPPENPAVDRILSSRVKGRLTARGALDQLLAGTALTYEFINTRTVVIRKQYGLADPMLHSDAGASAAQSTQRTAGDATANPGDSNHGRNNAATSYSNRVLAGLPVAEVIVAGTHIRGTSIVGSRVQVLDRTDINATGYTAVQDVLKTIPANLGGGQFQSRHRHQSAPPWGGRHAGTCQWSSPGSQRSCRVVCRRVQHPGQRRQQDRDTDRRRFRRVRFGCDRWRSEYSASR